MSSPEWKQFELAVAAFLEALGDGAQVTHDARLPDAQTGMPRQRDVWVEWTLGGHFPVKALVSCKYWSTVLDQQDIDHFRGEFLSSGAQIGIIYSRAGFGEHAIEKARALGFHCCRLYDDEPAELPEALILGLVYHTRINPRVEVRGAALEWGFGKWKDLFGLEIDGLALKERFRRTIEEHQAEGEGRYQRAVTGTRQTVELESENLPRLAVDMLVDDEAFRARMEFTKVNGSYNFTSKRFLGSQMTPAIDTMGKDPGPGWERIDLPPLIPSQYVMIHLQVDADEFVEWLGEQDFPQGSSK